MEATSKTEPQSKSIDYLHPVKYVLKPVFLVTDMIDRVFQGIFGYLSRIGVFSFGEWNRSWFKRKIIEVWKRGCDTTADRKGYSEERHLIAYNALIKMGGIQKDVYSKDGTKLNTMMFSYERMKQTIEGFGGEIVSTLPITIQDRSKKGSKESTIGATQVRTEEAEEFADVILFNENQNRCNKTLWNELCKDGLNHLGLEKIKLTRNGQLVEGYVIKHWDSENPNRPKEGQCIIRCCSPTESYPMAKRDIARHVLGLRADLFAWDHPGTWRSEGLATEGGYYAAAETIVDMAHHEYGYDIKDMWSCGFCLGAAVAIHLKKKYHKEGINLFVQNAFNSMRQTFKQQDWPANKLAIYGLPEVESHDPLTRALVEQDRFDSLGKLENLEGQYGTSIFIHTSTDQTIDPNSCADLVTAGYFCSEKVHSFMFEPERKDKNGHSLDVLKSNGLPEERRVWDTCVDWIAQKNNVALPTVTVGAVG